jgi:hypothetical protein
MSTKSSTKATAVQLARKTSVKTVVLLKQQDQRMILRLCRRRRPPRKKVYHVTPSNTSCSLISRRCREEEEKTRNLDINIDMDNDCSFSLTHQPALPGGGGEDKES